MIGLKENPKQKDSHGFKKHTTILRNIVSLGSIYTYSEKGWLV